MGRLGMRVAGAILFVAAMQMTSALAQTQEEEDWCYEESTDDQTIQGCTAVLQAARTAPEALAAAYFNRAVAYSNKGEHDRALADYDHAIRLNPGDAANFNGRCWERAILNQLAPALADCNESLRLQPDDANTLDSRGFTYLKMGDYDRAITDFDAALTKAPKESGTLFARGVARLRKGDQEGGNADVAAAKALDPKVAERYADYGVQP